MLFILIKEIILKNELLNAVKIKFKPNNRIITKDISGSFKKQPVYVNYQLSINEKKLLWLSEKIGSIWNFKYVWVNSSGVFIKIDDGTGLSNLSYLNNFDSNKVIAELWNKNLLKYCSCNLLFKYYIFLLIKFFFYYDDWFR